ncbi:MAG TPA: MopE-related protein [Candidatus Polarisedimenticolia bacterium]|nr:MopE-related protein [Candidatus Polarisedimenticolia bacterium]
MPASLLSRTLGALLLCSLAAAAARLGAAGAIRFADDNTCPATGAGTLTNPYCRIQDAICASAAGDEVSVAPGTYPESIRMKPGVSVISQGGAAVTTINAAGKPCTETDYCSKRTGNQCSVVIFGSGHTVATRLEGFIVTGGAGSIQTNQVAGGGVYLFHPGTVVNNVITNNVLSGPRSDFNGAGVYVAIGSPIISNNTISGNRAVPPAGSSGSVTFGYGGGLWLGFSSDAIVTNNIITGNQAGDPTLAYSLGAGGGMVVWTPEASLAGPRIDGNLVADNIADGVGGGIALLSRPGTGATTVVTNNVITGNAARSGGGVYTYFNKSRTVNNTITDNEAFLGGGVYSGQSDTTLPVVITNNIIAGNRLRMFGSGGGIYSLDLSATFQPVISFNDLWGNAGSQCGGELSDTSCIGTNGNFSADPAFLDAAGGNLRLTTGSPAIDRGSAAAAPPADKDGVARGVDGDGVPNSPQAGDVDVGAYEFVSGCLANPEVCDGADNNCNQDVDEGFPDTDGDLQADCVDPDDDDDLALDASDCAPLDPTAFALPVEVGGLDVTGPPAVLHFAPQSAGTGTRFEILSGHLGRLGVTRSFAESFCLAAAAVSSPWPDPRPDPPAGVGWYFLVGAYNACGRSTLGSPLRDAPGSGDVCPAGVVDQDGDGSPSDLDCNDADPSLSPIQAEICDGEDNDCDQVADDGNPGGGASCGASSVGECRPGTTACSGGSLICTGAVGPAPELCDQKDNDCDGVVDNNVVDSDGDTLHDCVDPDDDNDLVPDASDCAPLDPGAFGTPGTVADLDLLSGIPTPVHWTAPSLGPATTFDVASGLLDGSGPPAFSAGACLSSPGASPYLDSRAAPPAGSGWYYLVKPRNVCGPGTYGSAERDTLPACP